MLGAASNPLFISNTGTVTATGTANAISGGSGSVWTITNGGTLSAAPTGYGLSLAAAGTVSSSGLITGKDGVLLNAGGSVANSGSIGGSGRAAAAAQAEPECSSPMASAAWATPVPSPARPMGWCWTTAGRSPIPD